MLVIRRQLISTLRLIMSAILILIAIMIDFLIPIEIAILVPFVGSEEYLVAKLLDCHRCIVQFLYHLDCVGGHGANYAGSAADNIEVYCFQLGVVF